MLRENAKDGACRTECGKSKLRTWRFRSLETKNKNWRRIAKNGLISEKRGRFVYSYVNERRTLWVLWRSHGKNPNFVDTFYTANLSLVATDRDVANRMLAAAV